jgi:hypothetical protein
MKKKSLGAILATLALGVGMVGIAAAPAQAAACYSASATASITYAHAAVNYGSCTHGTTRSTAQLGITTADSGWYAGNTYATVSGWGIPYNANYYTSGIG